MARILTPDQFAQCPKGTVFAYGDGCCSFGELLILDSFLGPFGDAKELLAPFEGRSFGFYAIDPAGIEANDCGERYWIGGAMLRDGISSPACDSSTKYMSYDGEPMNAFLVYEREDWNRLSALALSAFSPQEEAQNG